MDNKVKPRTVAGMLELLPNDQITFNEMVKNDIYQDWGKYNLENGRLMMPLSMNIHHAVADGFHLCRFFNEVQELINNLK